MTTEQRELLELIQARIPTFPFSEDGATQDRASYLAKCGVATIVANLLKPGSVQAKPRAATPPKDEPPAEEQAPVRSRRPA